MKTMKFFFAMACVLGLATSCLAQNADTNVPTQRTSGIQAARAAALRALKAHAQSSDEVPATTPSASLVSGTFAFTITINLHPGFPTSDKIYCSANVYTFEEATDSDFDADGYVQATVSGSTATCTINLKYGWWLETPTTDSVGLGVDVRSTYGTEGSIPWWDNTSDWENTLTAVPASGSTTPVKVTTAL